MFQATMFGGEPGRIGKANGIRQATLGFRSAVDSGRRGDPSPTWLDAVLGRLASAGSPAPTLVDVQERWNARDTAEQAARWLATAAAMRDLVKRVRRQLNASPAPARVPSPAPAPMLALPAPAGFTIDPNGSPILQPDSRSGRLLLAYAAARGGLSIRSASERFGVPVTTIRRALGKVR